MYMKRILNFVLLALWGVMLHGQVTFHIDAGKRGATIGPLHYGIFFEEINQAGEGGLYAELIRNRSFEENATSPSYWSVVGKADVTLDRSLPLNPNNPTAVKVVMNGQRAGIRNEGFWGINIVRGNVYHLTLWARTDEAGYGGTISAELRNSYGTSIGKASIQGLTTEWQKYTFDIKATNNAADGTFALVGSMAGTVYYDVVSVFPPTYKGRENGCRIDLAEKLEALHPAFMRFPGGCFVEGNWTPDHPQSNHFEWKKTIGPIEERPGHYNNNWFYPVSDGLGMMEFLLLCEDLGAEPLYVVNMGMGHAWEDPNVQPYIQDALDAIEFCNGDASTVWGRKRIELGHPDPFHLRLLEIGNENYWFGPYADRYKQFRDAIAAKHPYITFIGDGDGVLWNLPHPVDAIDQHYYMTPAWFTGEYHRYDNYARDTYKIYVGEYAVTGACGHYGNMNAALGEAVFMCGMETNSDVVTMTSYAPIFCNENNYQWAPDIIRFNASMSYVTPSYYVQQMMAENHGHQNIKWTEENNMFEADNQVALSTWGTTATFDNLLVTSLTGDTLYFNDFSSADLKDWTNNGGTWDVRNGKLYQTDIYMAGALFTLNKKFGAQYVVQCEATKTGGNEGFLLAFNVNGKDDYAWWNVGGWANEQQGIEQCMSGTRGSDGGDVKKFAGITNGQAYKLKVEVNGNEAICYLNGERVNNKTLTTKSQKVYLAASIDDDTNTMYVKAVNPYNVPQSVVFDVKHANVLGGTQIRLNSTNGSDENTTANPTFITPRTTSLPSSAIDDNKVSVTLPAHSFSVYTLDFAPALEEPEQLPQPLVSYTFDAGQLKDDGGTYTFSLASGGKIVEQDTPSGNKVFFSDKSGYLDLGRKMPNDIFPKLSGDYAISIDICPTDAGPLNHFCWAYGLSEGTSHYVGLVNSPTNRNWYYEIRNTPANNSVQSDTGLSPNTWHNVTYTQENGLGSIYVDGNLLSSTQVAIQPSDIATRISTAYIARSPFAGDALMSNTYFDDFLIFGQSLSASQIATLYAQTAKRNGKSDVDGVEQLHTDNQTNGLFRSSIYDMQGRRVGGSSVAPGLYIKNGKKVILGH